MKFAEDIKANFRHVESKASENYEKYGVVSLRGTGEHPLFSMINKHVIEKVEENKNKGEMYCGIFG